MNTLGVENLRKLSALLEDPKNVNLDQIEKLMNETSWQKETKWGQWLCKRLKRENSKIASVVCFVDTHFACFESRGHEQVDKTVEGKAKEEAEKHIEQYNKEIKEYQDCFEKVAKWLKNEGIDSEPLKQEYERLKRSYVALRYRTGQVEKQKETDPGFLEFLEEKGSEWAKDFYKNPNRELNQVEIDQLKKATQYVELRELIEKNPSYLKSFFFWSLNNYCPVSAFVQYNHTRKFLNASRLANYYGRQNRPDKDDPTRRKYYHILTTGISGVVRKTLALPAYSGEIDKIHDFEPTQQDYVNIADPEAKIKLSHGYLPSVREVGKQTLEKKYEECPVNLTERGLLNCHPNKGEWNQKENRYMTKELDELFNPGNSTDWRDTCNWIQKLPFIGERFSQKFMNDLFKSFAEQGMLRKWKKMDVEEIGKREMFIATCASRSELSDKCLDCHLFVRFYLFDQKRENWIVKEVGIYMPEYQQRRRGDGAIKFSGTYEQDVCFYDQSGASNVREIATHPRFPDEAKTKEFAGEFYTHLVENRGIFQMAGEMNCTGNIQALEEKVFGKMKPDMQATYSDKEKFAEQDKKFDEMKLKPEEICYEDPMVAKGVPDLVRMDVADAHTGIPFLDKYLDFARALPPRLKYFCVLLMTTLLVGFRLIYGWRSPWYTREIVEDDPKHPGQKNTRKVRESLLKHYWNSYMEYGKMILSNPSLVNVAIEKRTGIGERGILTFGATDKFSVASSIKGETPKNTAVGASE